MSGTKDIITSIFCLFWLKKFILYYIILGIIKKNNNI